MKVPFRKQPSIADDYLDEIRHNLFDGRAKHKAPPDQQEIEEKERKRISLATYTPNYLK